MRRQIIDQIIFYAYEPHHKLACQLGGQFFHDEQLLHHVITRRANRFDSNTATLLSEGIADIYPVTKSERITNHDDIAFGNSTAAGPSFGVSDRVKHTVFWKCKIVSI